MGKTVVFNKTGYDPFVDFIKAYAIICVLLGHTFPYLIETGYSLWYGMQVPLFVLVQVFHSFKKDNVSFDFRKITIRIIIPFLLVQIGIVAVFLLYYRVDFYPLIVSLLKGGGLGPGSYYPWVYLQFAILLPLIKPWFDKGSKFQKGILVIIICEGLEILSALIHFPDYIYSLLAIRYFFLIYLGWIWVCDGIVINRKTLILSFLSLLSIIFFDYYYVNIEPWFFDTAWKTHRWPCYYYVAILLSFFLYVIYYKTKLFLSVNSISKFFARCSYEIFLMQMAIIVLLPSMDFISCPYLKFAFRFSLIWFFSILGGYLFHIIYNKLTYCFISPYHDRL